MKDFIIENPRNIHFTKLQAPKLHNGLLEQLVSLILCVLYCLAERVVSSTINSILFWSLHFSAWRFCQWFHHLHLFCVYRQSIRRFIPLLYLAFYPSPLCPKQISMHGVATVLLLFWMWLLLWADYSFESNRKNRSECYFLNCSLILYYFGIGLRKRYLN